MLKRSALVLAAGCVVSLAAFSLPVLAATKAGKKDAPTPVDVLRDYTVSLIDGMDEDQLRYIYEIRLRHGFQRATGVVRRDVGDAIGKCGKEHPSMKAGMESAFAQWTGKIDPLLKESQTALDKTIADQKFVEGARLKKLLDLVNAAGDYTEQQNPKVIITSEEACTRLLNNMSDSQDHLAQMLRQTLMSVPVPPSVGAVSAPGRTQETGTQEKSAN